MSEVVKWNSYVEMKDAIGKCMLDICNRHITLGYLFKKANESGLYRQAGYVNLYEFTKSEFNIERTQTLRFMQLNDEYSVGGDSVEILEEYREYGSSKLIEMLGLPEEIRMEIPPDAPREIIRDAKKIITETEKEKESENHPCAGAQMQIKTEFEGGSDTCENLVKEFFKTRKEDFTHYLKQAIKEQENNDFDSMLRKDALLCILAPSKFKLLKLASASVIINAEKIKIMPYKGLSEEFTHKNFLDAFRRIFDTNRTDVENYEGIYGEPWEESRGEIKETSETLNAPGLPAEQSQVHANPESKKGVGTDAADLEEAEENEEAKPADGKEGGLKKAAFEKQPEEESGQEKQEEGLPGQMEVEDYPEILPEGYEKRKEAKTCEEPAVAAVVEDDEIELEDTHEWEITAENKEGIMEVLKQYIDEGTNKYGCILLQGRTRRN